MVLFGVPAEMRDALVGFNRRRGVLDIPTIQIGIGVHCGQAVVGFVGSHLCPTSTDVGVVVNTATQLEQFTRQAEADFCISGAVDAAQKREQVAVTESLGKQDLKGRKEALEVFKVVGRESGAGPS